MKELDGKKFAGMIFQGAANLSNNADKVDALNVFPVPDGDTGTNMNLSMTSGSKEVKNNVDEHIGKVAGALSKGLLMGARGNSGVILSQLFRGFGKSIENKATLNTKEFAAALDAGVVSAYKAVMKPVEGTILTVAKDAAKQAVETAETEEDLIGLMEAVVKEAKASLKRTPDLLPVLKEVGVVDSGGQGLVHVYEGFLAELKGEEIPDAPVAPSMDELVSAEHHIGVQGFMNTEDIEFGYCTEFMVKLEEDKASFDELTFREELSELGDSLLVISDDEMAKVHIHTEQPGKALSQGQLYGSLIKIKIENMREQHTEIVGSDHRVEKKKPAEKQPYAIITVSMGEGIAELFRSIGATSVIEGGQTMNPSTEDIVKAIEEAHAEKVIILPNNKNIIMAAEQAAEVVEMDAVVVPSKSVPQGMAAILAFNPAGELTDNKETMTDALGTVKTGQVTFAVRDTSIDGITIKKDDHMGIAEGKIVTSGSSRFDTVKELLAHMMDEDAEIVTLLYGEDSPEEEVNEVTAYLEEQYPDAEVEVHNGKQPLYSYIVSIE
ncbi:DAK2 domain-containing protein [Jeotgalibacillus sp. R-1-5s-1]|uniref:DAK2 domain-containing protein n=1 Tax=Jeotgalibacillus sp. R-1-5s-1 TaxID=2555897 RepID=UPI0010695B0B|nr:DAK2 domain-containing protein [Jeotgalibacillus sp. R-1-5s-1]TFE03716.1 DAK2 domain-containing protein [Jeotgalibacillus sp. R-1-5s-1]